jgi:hypothetical protein
MYVFMGDFSTDVRHKKLKNKKIKLAALRLCVCLSWFKETVGLQSVRRSRVPTSLDIICDGINDLSD